MSKDLKDKTLKELEGIVVSLGQKKYLAGYIFKFIHLQSGNDISSLSTLSKAFRAQLVEQGYFISQIRLVESLSDPDGSAKFLFELSDGERIESVLLPEDKRKTLCVSTQVGCAMGCGFCATAKIRLRRSLTAAEIVDQVNAVSSALMGAGLKPAPTDASSGVRPRSRGEVVRGRTTLDQLEGRLYEEMAGSMNMVCDAHPTKSTNAPGARFEGEAPSTRKTPDGVTTSAVTGVVYMGMGEPLQNYEAVIRSIRILNDPAGRNIGIRHITISTCGVAPGIRQLADEGIHPRLAISLNAPTDSLRSKLMPINRKYPLAELLDAVREYQAKTGQRVTFEYVLMEKVNDSVLHARMLVKLLCGLMYNINLIEHNPYAGFEYAASSRQRIGRFASVLKDAGVETTIRFRMGRGIKAACGQLQAGYSPGKSADKSAPHQ